ncbi:ATP-grasp domain-containing protein [Sphaerisporangium sp. TRM90804]|uniref:ATP-grasp domain-containing protein n=1 Tax=Sphaerisporangium sp. TRM90804 TaxID=3031113 RepID=UPI00244B0880|nr:ATP-grasp domain-containing protein [Sphaerisporangium sp. TRM90804]MDH2425009.1 ATP-grasp domain-containing protein [Sphaerisporangium sp. TRM90804]
MPSRALPHYLVVNRYDDEDAEYFRYCAGHDCALSFLTPPGCVKALGPVEPGRVATVADLRPATLVAPARELAERYGPFDGIAALSEHDVLTAALLREEFGCPGPGADLVRAFRDKVVMKDRLAKQDLPIPRFMELGSSPPLAEISARIGYPLVLKPRAEAGSVGVRILGDERELTAAVQGLDLTRFECEEFVSTEIYHADGVLSEGRRHFLSVSGYVNTPLDFLRGKPLGSASLDAGPLREQISELAITCVKALGLVTGCFHVEIIRRPDGGLVFLEAGMRPGGAEVPYIHRDFHGVDLMAESFRTVLGIPLQSARPRSGDASAGWVVMPEPRHLPGRVVRRTAMTGVVPQVYAEVLPEPGEVFDGTGGYFHVPGRFRLTGPDERSVRAAARRVMDEYVVEFAPLEAP